jgi:NTE family protein
MLLVDLNLIHWLRHVVREPANRLPEELRADPLLSELASYGCATRMHLVNLDTQRIEGEDLTRDIDFTLDGLRMRHEAGHAAARRAIERQPWRGGGDFLDGIVVHDQD